MNYWETLDSIWRSSGKQKLLRVRFNDWTHQIRYFQIFGESEDGKRLVGRLDTGEKMSFSKKSKGWSYYDVNDEFDQAHAI
jgi:hypothetical protein